MYVYKLIFLDWYLMTFFTKIPSPDGNGILFLFFLFEKKEKDTVDSRKKLLKKNLTEARFYSIKLLIFDPTFRRQASEQKL